MIKKLRKRVASYTILSVAVVLLLLMSTINIANFISKDRSSSEILDLLLENDGRFPGGKHGEQGGPFGPASQGGATQGDAAGQGGGAAQSAAAGQGGGAAQGDAAGQGGDAAQSDATPGKTAGGKDSSDPWSGLYNDDFDYEFEWEGKRPRDFNEETPFETRFFSVNLDESGEVSKTDIGQIAAVSSVEADTMAQEIFASGKSSGYLGNYKYASKETDGGTMYVFLDCGRDLNSVKNFLKISLLVSLVGLLAIAALVIVFSPLMVKPMIESYEKQKRFISDAGHELKTPLAVIGSCAEVLEMETGENKWVSGIKDQVGRMTTLTHDLISLAKMDEAEMELKKEDVNLSDLCTDALATFSLMAEQKGRKLIHSISPGIKISGNEKTLSELINILLDNAIKYATGENIIFSLRKNGRQIILETRNQAEGFLPGKQNQLFDRFYRGDFSRTWDGNGSGAAGSSGGVSPAGGAASSASASGGASPAGGAASSASASVGASPAGGTASVASESGAGSKAERSTSSGHGYGIGLSMAQSIVLAHGGSIEANSPDGKSLVITAKL